MTAADYFCEYVVDIFTIIFNLGHQLLNFIHRCVAFLCRTILKIIIFLPSLPFNFLMERMKASESFQVLVEWQEWVTTCQIYNREYARVAEEYETVIREEVSRSYRPEHRGNFSRPGNSGNPSEGDGGEYPSISQLVVRNLNCELYRTRRRSRSVIPSYRTSAWHRGCEKGETPFEHGLNHGLERGYKMGRADGFKLGKEKGLEEGHALGHKDGFTDGYSKGFKKGHSHGYLRRHYMNERTGY